MTCADVRELHELRVENETLKHRLRIHDTTDPRHDGSPYDPGADRDA